MVKGEPGTDHLLVLMDANARTVMGRIGCTDSEVMGACGRDELNDNGERLLIHATDNKLALLNTYYATPARGVLYTFKSPNRGKVQYRLDYIPTRQVIDDRNVISLCRPHPRRMLIRTTISCSAKKYSPFGSHRTKSPRESNQKPAGC